jgi:hypothetical protein
VREAQKLVR